MRTKSLSLADQAAEQIRQLIVDGSLQPGQALSETALAAELGVSKTPIREALLRLETESLVQILPQRGTFVFQLSATEAHALSEFRSVIELAALARAMQRDAAALAAALDVLLRRMKSAPDARVYCALDDLFHRCIIEHARNAYMTEAYENVAQLVQTLRNRLVMDPKLNARSLKDHTRLVQSVASGNADRAAALLEKHIAKTTADYATRLRPRNSVVAT